MLRYYFRSFVTVGSIHKLRDGGGVEPYRGLATKWNFDKMELLKNFYLHKVFKNGTFELWGLDDFLYKFLKMELR